ncbi:MAG: hypothetical protein GY714_24765 [Desulfobacterales bacterium]|nr:hypothetical protein [Desulfobacterales bacterium]
MSLINDEIEVFVNDSTYPGFFHKNLVGIPLTPLEIKKQRKDSYQIFNFAEKPNHRRKISFLNKLPVQLKMNPLGKCSLKLTPTQPFNHDNLMKALKTGNVMKILPTVEYELLDDETIIPPIPLFFANGPPIVVSANKKKDKKKHNNKKRSFGTT